MTIERRSWVFVIQKTFFTLNFSIAFSIRCERYKNWYLTEQKTVEELRKKLEYRKVVKVEEGRGSCWAL